MICSGCRKRIDTVNDDFEEVGSIEFMHVKCVDELLERKSALDDEERTQADQVDKRPIS